MINTTIAQDQLVPTELWGRDHWSTLAYIEAKLVDGDYSVKFDPRMRQGRRNFRVLSKGRGCAGGVVMQPEHGSRLSDGTILPWSDDWACVQDMLADGLFEDGEWDTGFPLKLTEKGYAVAAALRKHKAEGGTYSNFKVA